MIPACPILKTEKLTLKSILETDIKYILEGLSDPDVIRYYGVSFDSLENTKEQMNWYADLVKNKTGIWWGIYSDESQSFLGAIGLNDIHATHHKAELGFWLLKQYWGNGIIVQAAKSVLQYAFNDLNLHRIEALVETENISSKKVLNKLDFIHEGSMKECEMKNDKWISVDIFAKIKDDSK